MAMTELDNAIQELNRRFSMPLPEFYDRRIIFWYDGEYEDKIEEIELQDAKIIQEELADTVTAS